MLIFDLDGTLVDSRQDIVNALIHSIEFVGGRIDDGRDLSIQLGRPLFNIMYDLMGDGNLDKARDATEEYRRYFFDNCASATTAYDGVIEVLDALHGKVKMAVATTKMTFMADRVLELLGMTKYFDLIQGTDGFDPKPAPDIIFKVTETLGIKPEFGRVWMIGDRDSDIVAGQKAGVSTCFALYGFGGKTEAEKSDPNCRMTSMRDLPASLGLDIAEK